MPFYEFAIKNYDFNEFGFDSQDPQYWNAFINYPFREFSRNQPDQAQVIINKIVLPSHSFLSQVLLTFQTADFLDQFIPDIDMYLDKVAYTIFIQEFSQILALEDLSEAEILCEALLRKAKNISFDTPEFKYHHAFIVNLPFHYFKRIHLFYPEYYNDICSYISKLAPFLYYEIAEESKQLAEKILAEVLPSHYLSKADMDITEKTYEKTISEYQGSLLQPIDNSYLWDPQQFHSDLLEAVQTLINVENPNLPYYTMIIEFITKDSDLAHLFRHYIAQNYCKPSNLRGEHQPVFWRSLIVSSFTGFSSRFPHYSSQIIEQMQSLSCLDEFQSLFVYEILDDQFSPKYYFSLVSECGHTFTVDLLLQHRTDIAASDVSSALGCAARAGQTSTVDLILQHFTDIAAAGVGSALDSAAEGGHISTVDLILQRRTDLNASTVGWALSNAVKGRHTNIIDRLFQRCTGVSSPILSLALSSAIEIDLIYAVDLFTRTDTNIDYVDAGLALDEAAELGHTHIIDLLLQRRTDITAYYARQAFKSAAKKGHTPAVNLLQRHPYIAADDVCLALINAVKDGHSSTSILLLQRCIYIAAYKIGRALYEASVFGYSTSFNLLQRRTNIDG
jgi:hypothetical protein